MAGLTGTMANQVALRVLTRPGDDVLVSQESHAVWHETGASAANAGVQFTAIGKKGLFTPEDFLAALKPRDHIIYPPTTLVEVENTHNRSGGTIFPQDDVKRICAAAAEREIATYLDGARLWNAAVASGRRPAELAEPFGLVLCGAIERAGGARRPFACRIIRSNQALRPIQEDARGCNEASRDICSGRALCSRPQHRATGR